MEANQGDIGGGDARDVAAGARLLAQDPDIDPARIVCGGGSYGGYMTYRQLTHFPELWAGGIAIVGITDWEHMYGESMPHFQHLLHRLFGGSPSEVPERYRAASPIHEAERLRAPILILHGLNDPRCPIAQARRFRDRLLALGRREGRDFLYHELGDQGHGSADVGQRLATYGRIDDFLGRLSAAPSALA
jgi:dipeptidyl aminopeptidase/acylaminoacyl peptidase